MSTPSKDQQEAEQLLDTVQNINILQNLSNKETTIATPTEED